MSDIVMSRAAVLEEARSWIGTPYRHQASCKGAGADCLGLIRGIYVALIGPVKEIVPAYTASWAEDMGQETLRDAARRHLVEIDPADAGPGDILLFRWRGDMPAKHAAILSSPDRMIHAYDGHSVFETSIPDQWRRRIAFAFRFPGVED